MTSIPWVSGALLAFAGGCAGEEGAGVAADFMEVERAVYLEEGI